MKKFLFACLVSLLAIYATAQPYRNEWIDYTKTYYKFSIATNGLYRITKPQLDALGIGAADAAHFKMWRNGVEVPLYTTVSTGPLGNADYIEFVGEKNDGKPDADLYLNTAYQPSQQLSLFCDTAAYFLTIQAGANKRIVNQANNLTAPGTPDPYYISQAEFTFNNQLWGGHATYIQNEYVRSASFDKAEGFQSNRFNTLAFPTAPLKANLTGPPMSYTTNGAGAFIGARTIFLSFNDSVLKSTLNFDFENYTLSANNIPLSRISNDIINIKYNSSGGSEFEKIFVSYFKLTYPRNFDFDNQANYGFTIAPSDTSRYLQIANFNHSGQSPILIDLTNGLRYTCLVDAGFVKVKLAPSTLASQMLLVSTATANIQAVSSFTTRNFINYSQTINQGNYLIIANKILNTGGSNNQVEAYRAYRASTPGGAYNAIIADIDELADQFAYGIRKHPISIRNFSRFARANFTINPKFYLLIGRGVTYADYYNHQNAPNAEQLNQVPTWGSPASDNMLTAISNAAPLQATPIGRLAVVNSAELKAYLDKVKAYEILKANNTYTQANKDFTKQVLHLVGAGDAQTAALIQPLMDSYRNIMRDTLIGADVHNYSKTNNANLTQSTAEVANYINAGVSLLTYFGHSSATSLDFNLNNPADYTNTNGKYPVFIANGCNAGEFYTYDESRLNDGRQTISERFTLAPERGAIAFIASTHFGVLNTLDYATTEWYKAACRSMYGKTIGEIQLRANADCWAIYTGDFHTRLTLEETTIHGDPAIRLFNVAKPDYSIEPQNLTISPAFISAASDSFFVKIKPYNLGRASNDSITIKIQRRLPNGSIKQSIIRKLKGIRYADSIQIALPIIGNVEKGTNTLEVTLDPDNQRAEESETNNAAIKTFEISTDEIRPVYPYPFSVVNKTTFTLYGSTADVFEPLRTYRLQMDTTELFNSSLLSTQNVASIGGLVAFTPNIAPLTNGVVYYWRIAPVVNGMATNWRSASFLYNPNGSFGWNQSHLYQHLKSDYSRIGLDSLTRKYTYLNRLNNVFINNSIYPFSGVEDSHFSVSINGDPKFRSVCLGHSVVFNVLDSVSFQPMRNFPGGLYGSAANTCFDGRDYNFEFSYMGPANRKKITDFMDSIPSGNFVIARLIFDLPEVDSAYANTWKKDTLIYGSQKSLYHALFNAGFADLDSMNKPRTWAFVYKKGSNAYTPQYAFSQGLYDRLVMSTDCFTNDTLGFITSPKFGPARQWQNVHWQGHSLETLNSPDSVLLSVVGINNAGAETTLFNLRKSQTDVDISSINAATYPYIKLRLRTQDSINATPWQLESWKLDYTPQPEGGLAPSLFFVGGDSAANDSNNSKYPFGIAFKNISDVAFADSIKLTLVVADSLGNKQFFNLPKTKPLISGDTVSIYFEINTNLFANGAYNLSLDVNPNNDQYEQFHFNNFLFKTFIVSKLSGDSCPGTSRTLYAGSSTIGSTYQWQVDMGSGFINLSNGANYTGVNTDSLKVINPLSSTYGYKYRCAITNNALVANGNLYTLTFSNRWVGGFSNAWEAASNWSCGQLPDENTDVLIPAGVANNPIVNSNAVCRSLRVSNAAAIRVAAGFKLDIKGVGGN